MQGTIDPSMFSLSVPGMVPDRTPQQNIADRTSLTVPGMYDQGATRMGPQPYLDATDPNAAASSAQQPSQHGDWSDYYMALSQLGAAVATAVAAAKRKRQAVGGEPMVVGGEQRPPGMSWDIAQPDATQFLR